MSVIDMRKYKRNLVQTEVIVNDGVPYRGGMLRELSRGGALVIYPVGVPPEGEPLVVGQELLLSLAGKAKMPSRVVRVFDEGFASKFDFSLDRTAS